MPGIDRMRTFHPSWVASISTRLSELQVAESPLRLGRSPNDFTMPVQMSFGPVPCREENDLLANIPDHGPSLLVVDDSHRFSAVLAERLSECASPSTRVLLISTVDDPRLAGTFCISPQQSVRELQSALLARRDEILPLVQVHDDRVGDRYMDISFESRLALSKTSSASLTAIASGVRSESVARTSKSPSRVLRRGVRRGAAAAAGLQSPVQSEEVYPAPTFRLPGAEGVLQARLSRRRALLVETRRCERSSSCMWCPTSPRCTRPAGDC